MAVFPRKFDTNVSEAERLVSVVGGGSLLAYGLLRRDAPGFGLAALGGALVHRGVTGHCNMYQSLGVNTARQRPGVPYELGIRVDREIYIERSPDDVYRFWRNFENLPRFMDHLESVRVIDDRRSHWTAKGPIGITVDWHAEIVNDIPGQVIGWRSLEGSEVDTGGSVRFESSGAGTSLKVSLQYNPPAGSLGAAIARMFGEDPRQTIQQDLRRFKELIETGAVSTRTQKKSVGRREVEPVLAAKGKSGRLWDRDAVQGASEESFPASDPPSWTPEAL